MLTMTNLFLKACRKTFQIAILGRKNTYWCLKFIMIGIFIDYQIDIRTWRMPSRFFWQAGFSANQQHTNIFKTKVWRIAKFKEHVLHKEGTDQSETKLSYLAKLQSPNQRLSYKLVDKVFVHDLFIDLESQSCDF